MNYHLVTAATALPVSIEDMKKHLRVTHSDHDAMIEGYIWSAVAKIEGDANLCLSSQTWDAFYNQDEVVEILKLYKYPVSSITTVKYYDTDDSQQTVASGDYTAFLTGKPATIQFDDTPSVYDRDAACEVRFIGKFTTVPYDIILAIKLYVARVYDNPQDPVDEKIGYVEKVIEKYRSRGTE